MEHKYNNGSEWRKWDLHLHTASSYDYDYKADDADILLVKSLETNKISVVAITDHFIIDKQRIDNLRSLSPEIIFFPGVELRTDKGDTNIHIILIFSNTSNLDDLSEDFNAFKRTNAKNPNDNDRIYWDFNDILDFAKNHDALISIHAGSKTSGIDDKISNSLGHNQAVKEEFAKNVHIFEMGKISDIEGYKKHVFPNIGNRPMVICSDNHNPRNFQLKTNCWIKADPTFDGLKQIICEPEDRVRIQIDHPDDKKSYNIIDKVKFVDNSGADKFSCKEIGFSSGLNAIIGGKSSGKSLLMHMIASEMGNITDIKNYQDITKDTYIEIYYKDDPVQKKTKDDARIIEFLPQLHIENLVRNQEYRTKTDRSLNEFIASLIKQDESIKTIFETSNSVITEATSKIESAITEWGKLDIQLSTAKNERVK